MKSQDSRYVARFLAASRIALGLTAGPRTARETPTCALTEMRLTASQRERVLAVLQAHVPVIRTRMKAARRAHQARCAPTSRDLVARFAGDEAEAEIARLQAGAIRDLRSILTPYQYVQLDARRRTDRRRT